MFSMEVSGLNTGKFFFLHFHILFYPAVAFLLEHLDPVIYSCLVFAL